MSAMAHGYSLQYKNSPFIMSDEEIKSMVEDIFTIWDTNPEAYKEIMDFILCCFHENIQQQPLTYSPTKANM